MLPVPSLQLLIAEDSAIVRERLVRLAREHLPADSICSVGTGADAIAVFDRSRPDAVLLDLGLPDMSGLEVLEHIRRRGTTTEVVVFTNWAGPEMAARCHLLGADHFVSKAHDVGPVIEILRTIAAPESGAATTSIDPAVPSTLARKEPGGDRSIGANPVSVLVVEDDVSQADLLLKLLPLRLPRGSSVRRAGSQAEALDCVRNGRFEVVLLDLGLPDCEGAEAVVALRLASPAAAIIVLSAQHDDATVELALQGGADDYFIKGELAVEGVARAIISAAKRQRSARALTIALESRRRIMDSSVDVICTLDAAGRFVEVGAACERLWGYSREELVGRISTDWLAAADRAKSDEFLDSVRRGATTHEFENQFICKDGSSVDMMWSANWSAGDRLMYCVAHDITTRKRNEETLRATIESALDCIITIDESNTVLEFNPAAEQTFGWSRAEALGQQLSALIIPPEFRDGHARGMAKLLQPGQSQLLGRRVEIRAIHADGTEFPAELSLVRLGTGRPARFTAFLRGITERVTARQKLEAQEEQYRVLFESSPNAMWVYDLKNLRILAVNHAAVHQYGYTREEFLDLTLLDLRPREDRDNVIEAISAEGAAARYAGTWTHRAKGGRTLLVDVYSSPTKYEGIPARMAVLVDVTEQKRAETALRQSELSLANAQRIAHLGNWDWNLETGELLWSQQVFEVFGIAPGEFDRTYEGFLRAVYANDRARVDASVQAALRGDGEYDLDHRILWPDGSIRTVHEHGEIARDASGRAVRMAGTVQDITERKLADQAFYESQEKYRNIVETANEGIWLLDAAGLTTYANQQLTTMLGYSTEEMIGRPIFDFVFQESVARAGDDLAQRQAGFSARSEYRLRRKDGTEVVALCSSSPICDASGKVTALLTMISDITERKRAEEALRASEERFSSAFEFAPTGMAIGSPDGPWLKVNQALCDLLGYSVSELTGKYPYEVTHPENRDANRAMMGRLLAGEVPFFHTETRFLHQQGKDVWASVGVSLVRDHEGKPLHFISQIQDITARKNAEAAAEKSDAELRVLAAQLQTEKERLVVAQAVAKIGSWETNLLNQSVLWSAETYRIFGLEPRDGDHTPERFSRSIHPDDRAAVDAAFAASLHTDRPSAIEHRIVMPDGRIKFVEERWQIERAEDGTALRSNGTCQDITERKQAEHAAARTLQRLSEAQRIGQIGDWEWDIATQAIIWSPQVFAIVGRDPSLGSPKTYDEYAGLYDATNAALLAASISLAMESGEGQEHELAMTRADGQRIHLHGLVVPRKDRTGQVIGLSGTIQDITVRKSTEAAASRLLSVLEVSLNEIYIFDADTLHFEFVNECALRNLGHSMEAMRAQTPLDLKPEFTAHQFDEMVAPLRRQEKPKVVFETVHRRADSSLYPVEVHLQLVQRGEKDVFLAIINDITERKRAEHELEELNKQLLATSRQAGMAEVATSVLHNVGNVLNSVNVSCSIVSEKVRTSRIGTVAKTAELLREHADDLATFFATDPAGQKLPAFLAKLSERLVQEQKAILSEVQSLSGNIAHIKEIVAVQQSFANVRGLRETLPIVDLIEDAIRINAESLARHRVEIVQEFSELALASVDKHKVLQILVNLVRNAKHALVDSGRADKRLVLRVAPCNDTRFVVSVSDNGIGIEPQNITRVFAHGFTTKKDGHGFGLHSGVLAAQEMGGSLTVHSDGVGCGATFSLELPLDGGATV